MKHHAMNRKVITAIASVLIAGLAVGSSKGQTQSTGIFTDLGASSFQAACSATPVRQVLHLVKQAIVSVPAGTSCSVPLVFEGEILQPSAGVPVTLNIAAAPSQKIFDLSAGGAIAFSKGVTAFVTWFGAICDSATDNTAAVMAADLATRGGGSKLYFPGCTGVYLINNSGSNYLNLSSDTNFWAGDGQQSTISCTNINYYCFVGVSMSNFTMSNLSFKTQGTPASRDQVHQLIQFQFSTNIHLDHVWASNTDGCNFQFIASTWVWLTDIYASNSKSNAVLFYNGANVWVTDLTTNNTGDAIFEASFNDNWSTYPCKNINLAGFISEADVEGPYVNGCVNASIANGVVDSPLLFGLNISSPAIANGGTTNSHWSDGTVISNVTINSPGQDGVYVGTDNLSTAPWHVNISNVHINNPAYMGLASEGGSTTAATLDLSLTNVDVYGSGQAGFQFNGYNVRGSNLNAENSGWYSFWNEGSEYLTLSNITSINPNQSAGSPHPMSFVTESNGFVSVLGYHIIDTRALSLSGVYDYSGYDVCNTNGSAISLAHGVSFPTNGGWAHQSMVIAGTNYTIAAVQSPTQLTLTGSAGNLSGVACNVLIPGQHHVRYDAIVSGSGQSYGGNASYTPEP